MKTKIFAAAALSLLAAACSPNASKTAAESDTPADDAFLFTYFTGESDGLRLAYSTDGVKWEAFEPEAVFISPVIGKDSLMRDPSVVEAPDGTFHLVWTTGWHDQVIAHASTRDFVNWSEQQEIPVMTHIPATENSWAPEIFFDEASGRYYIYWASTIADTPEHKAQGHRIYLTTTADFKEFSPTVEWFAPDFSVIDAAIVKSPLKGDYIMVVKNENEAEGSRPAEKNLRVTRSASIAEGFPVEVSAPVTGAYWAEGPAPLYVNDSTLYVYFDKYMDGKYGAIRSTDDGATWTDVSDEVSFPQGIRHGTAIRVKPEVLDRIRRAIAEKSSAAE